jgi:glutamate-1-semialdehyde 2,1-aminomutase
MLETQSRLRAISQAAGALAGGVSSPVRAGAAVGGRPFVQRSGRGAYAFDSQGRAYVDYVMAYGPLLFGHAHPALVTGLDALAAGGSVFGSTHAEEVRLAERIAKGLPSIQTLRFVSTGTEAMMSAFRTARAFTGRPAIVRFAGNYHGHFDAALHDAGASAHTPAAECSGIPARTAADAIVARYNDLADLDAKLAPRADEVAAIALEPIVANMGLVLPDPGFLAGVFERARRAGALVIFDEVITWLRLGLRGAQPRVGVKPDMIALGKVMGGGFPIAAFGGREVLMKALAPIGETFTGGTHGGNPFGVGMAHRVLDLLEAHPEYYALLDALGGRLATGIRAILAQRNLPFAVVQHESIVDFKFRPGPPGRNYDDARAADGVAYAHYYHAMRDRKILLPPSQNEVMFVSTEHTAADIDETLESIDAALSAHSLVGSG